MICINCKKQIPDDAGACPYCGSPINYEEQVGNEIKFRRYQRWILYSVIIVVFLGMVGIIFKIYSNNSKLVADLMNANLALETTKAGLETAKKDLSTKDQKISEIDTALQSTKDELSKTAEELSAKDQQLSAKDSELLKKTEDYKGVLDENSSIKATQVSLKKTLNAANANIYNLIIKLGLGISESDIKKIPIADANMVGKDSDGDGLSDIIESSIGTNINKSDTDGDGYNDKSEILSGYDPLAKNKKLPIDKKFASKQIGKILLQVKGHGEAWYVSGDGKRYFLGNPSDAFKIMRDLDYWTKDWKPNETDEFETNKNANSTEEIIPIEPTVPESETIIKPEEQAAIIEEPKIEENATTSTSTNEIGPEGWAM